MEPLGQKLACIFQLSGGGGKIFGFYGSVEGPHLESIGAHVEPVSHIHPFKNAGPFGSERGRQWDDGRHGSIKRIVITWERVIRSIKCVHDNDGNIVEGIRHGGTGAWIKRIYGQFTLDIFFCLFSSCRFFVLRGGQVVGVPLLVTSELFCLNFAD